MIFLSASVPDPNRNPRFFESADIFAIRDAVRALATVVIPNTNLVWGGHPAITPLIRYVMTTLNYNVQERVTLYQSEYFRKIFPKDNQFIEKMIVVEEGDSRDSSLLLMRQRMFETHKFSAGIFIGGMEGVEEEYELFKQYHPNALTLPIASTGAAAKSIHENLSAEADSELLTEYAYMSLFKRKLKDFLH